jgi:hypothetical protein
MTPRSLVGMTMGARKRAARNEDDYTRSAEYLFQRTKYRIGQRLRPCPGCHTCMPGVKGWHIDKVRGRFKVPTIAWSCDGSGVLPARAKKVRR